MYENRQRNTNFGQQTEYLFIVPCGEISSERRRLSLVVSIDGKSNHLALVFWSVGRCMGALMIVWDSTCCCSLPTIFEGSAEHLMRKIILRIRRRSRPLVVIFSTIVQHKAQGNYPAAPLGLEMLRKLWTLLGLQAVRIIMSYNTIGKL